MVRIEYKKTMGFNEFVSRLSILCPTLIKREIREEQECYLVTVEELLDIHYIAISDAAHILSHPGTSLLKILDIKYYGGKL